MKKSKSWPFSGIYAGSQATFDLYIEDEKVRLHKGASQCYFLIVMTHAEPQRERNNFNTSDFCAAATIPGAPAFPWFHWDEASQKKIARFEFIWNHISLFSNVQALSS